MIKRIVSALVLGVVAGLCLVSGYPFFHALIALIAVAMGWEWARICGAGSNAAMVALLMAVGPLAVVMMVAGPLWWAVAAVAGVAVLLFALAPTGRAPAPWVAAGAVYVGVPAIAAIYLFDGAAAGPVVVFWVILVVAATDCGAFFAGRAIGGARLAPGLSPNKTWAGLAGGVAAAALVGLAFGLYYAPEIGIVLMCAGIAAAVIAQLGDLLESVVKRRFGVKDASGLMPGHGGVLDRVDGVVAVLTVTALYAGMQGGIAAPWS